MTDPFLPRVGGTLSADIAVPEHERELRFYSQVLGTGANPLWRDDLMNSRGEPIIGLGARSVEYEDLPLQWMPHIMVADVAASAKRALDLGGSELMHGKDGEGKSQWAVLLDPNGAAFGIIPVVSAESSPPNEDVPSGASGCISWLDLTVPDASAMCEFYRAVVGWSVEDVRTANGGEHQADFTMLGGDGRPAAEIRHAGAANPGLPPVWMIHLPVGDLAESVRRVREGGGRVIMATRGRDGAYSHAAIEDPVGACLTLVAAPIHPGS